MYIKNFIDAFDMEKSKYRYNEKYDFYTFIPKETNIVAIIITACSILFIGGGTFLGYKCGLKNINKSRKNKGKEVELPVFGE